MAFERLKKHYESKYAHEAEGSQRVVAYTTTPSDRFEASLYYFTRNFRGGDILEVGAGDGTVARSILNHGISFTSYTLTDLSEVRARSAAQSLRDPRFQTFSLDIENQPRELMGRSFDAILMIALIEHLVDPISGMRYLAGLLAHDGFIYVDTPNISKYTRRVKLLLGQFPSTASRDEGLTTYDGKPVDLYDEGHLHYWTFRSLEEMLSRYCGLSKIERAPYCEADTKLPRRLAHQLACLWPEAFSELSIIARK
jgi:2-polyprenyl-3-methyl-5-hydroxy-6-metoxy-1,4-benzoquinol methylase